MKTNKTNFFWTKEDWRDQIYQLVTKNAQTPDFNETEEVGVFLTEIITKIRFYSDELERFLIRKSDVGDIGDFYEYECMVMAQLDQSETYQMLKNQNMQTIQMSKRQLSLVKELMELFVTRQNSIDYQNNRKTIGFRSLWNLCRKISRRNLKEA